MSLSNKKLNQGFTIVELLIVIVVIGILAAITIVAYNGITQRANTNAAAAAAGSFSKKAELYNADSGNNRYPYLATELTSAASTTTYYLTGVTPNYSTTALTSSSPNNTIRVLKCAAAAANQAAITNTNITGLRVIWFDYSAGAEIGTPINIGTTTVCPTT